MDRKAIRATVRKGIEAHDRKLGLDTQDFGNLVECIVDEFITEQEDALQRVIELYPEAEKMLRSLYGREPMPASDLDSRKITSE